MALLSLHLGRVISLRFYETNKKQTWQDGRLACTNFALQVMMASIFFMWKTIMSFCDSISSLTNALGRFVGQYVLALTSKWWWSHYHGVITLSHRVLVHILWWWLYHQLLVNIMVGLSTILLSVVVRGLLELDMNP